MIGWHHQLNAHEFEHTPGVGDGQGGLVCCSPWGLKESDMTERLNWTEVLKTSLFYLLVVMGLLCFVMAILYLRQTGTTLWLVHRLLIEVASLVMEHRLWGVPASVAAAPRLQGTDLVVVVHEFSGSMACGIFVDQGSNRCLLHWLEASLPLSHQGSPNFS